MATREDRSLGELFSELTQETRTLLRQEVELAKAEVSEKVSQAEKGLVSLTVGGLVAYAGFLGLCAAAIIGLSLVVDLWIAALAVGIIVLAVGLILVNVGRAKLKRESLSLSRTTRTLQEDKQWAKAQIQMR